MAKFIPNKFSGALDISRFAAHDDGPDIIRIRVTDGTAAGRLIQFELSINDFARAVMGTGHVPVMVDDVPMRRTPPRPPGREI
jgi:hypothetical protein